jgi:hypothetical protein
MKNFRYLMLLAFVSLSFIHGMGQYENPDDTGESEKNDGKGGKSRYSESRFFFGGNLGLSFGTYTYIEIAPLAGYKITPRLWAGLGPKYMYIRQRDYYENSIYGLKTFASFTILKDISETININLGDIFVYGENETLNLAPLYYSILTGQYFTGERSWYNITLIGGGMRFPIGPRAGFSIMALWDITQNPEYHYSNPEIRISVDF